jgi:hypothetical protein
LDQTKDWQGRQPACREAERRTHPVRAGQCYQAWNRQGDREELLFVCLFSKQKNEQAGPAKMPFHKMENINRFIEAAQKLGVKELDVFATVDLYEAKNMTKVIDTLTTLKRVTGQ